jgi:hypothetical protein
MSGMLARLPNGDWIDPDAVVIVAAHAKDDEGPDSAYLVCRVGNLAVKHEILVDSPENAESLRDEIVRCLVCDEEATQGEGERP